MPCAVASFRSSNDGTSAPVGHRLSPLTLDFRSLKDFGSLHAFSLAIVVPIRSFVLSSSTDGIDFQVPYYHSINRSFPPRIVLGKQVSPRLMISW
jgi:hypothetical protein